MPQQKVILVTGGNAGLGLQCCLYLAKQPDVHLILAGRNPERVHAAVQQVQAAANPTTTVESGIVDLTSLASVRKFANELLTRNLQIFSIVCNAGIQVLTKTITEDGFESTFQANHLGHFLLVTTLLDHTKRVVTLSSETHDPAENTKMPEPVMSDLDQLAKGLEPFNGLGAYATSKLCNLLFAKEITHRFQNGPEAIAYSPGLMLDTQLFHETKPAIGNGLDAYKDRAESSENSGKCLAQIAFEEPLPYGWQSGMYIRVREAWEPSALAKDKEVAKALWEKSEELVKST